MDALYTVLTKIVQVNSEFRHSLTLHLHYLSSRRRKAIAKTLPSGALFTRDCSSIDQMSFAMASAWRSLSHLNNFGRSAPPFRVYHHSAPLLLLTPVSEYTTMFNASMKKITPNWHVQFGLCYETRLHAICAQRGITALWKLNSSLNYQVKDDSL